jgi:hypothetical protein
MCGAGLIKGMGGCAPARPIGRYFSFRNFIPAFTDLKSPSTEPMERGYSFDSSGPINTERGRLPIRIKI